MHCCASLFSPLLSALVQTLVGSFFALAPLRLRAGILCISHKQTAPLLRSLLLSRIQLNIVQTLSLVDPDLASAKRKARCLSMTAAKIRTRSMVPWLIQTQNFDVCMKWFEHMRENATGKHLYMIWKEKVKIADRLAKLQPLFLFFCSLHSVCVYVDFARASMPSACRITPPPLRCARQRDA